MGYMRRTTLVKEQDRRRASDGLSSQTNGGLLSYLEAHSSLFSEVSRWLLKGMGRLTHAHVWKVQAK